MFFFLNLDFFVDVNYVSIATVNINFLLTIILFPIVGPTWTVLSNVNIIYIVFKTNNWNNFLCFLKACTFSWTAHFAEICKIYSKKYFFSSHRPYGGNHVSKYYSFILYLPQYP
jgi:hypothetical protein